MRLYDEIFKNADGAAMERCAVVPNGGGYFEGVKALGEFSPTRIVLCFPKIEVEVLGEGLSVRKYYDGDLQIAGKISALKTLGGEGTK